ncbi:MAG: primosomal protein N' (replication factor Y) - superfamily II helicase [Pseudomonadota bacterium]
MADGRPDKPERGASPDEIAGERRFPCPQCGGRLAYDPARDALACGHCGHVMPPLASDVDTPPLEELDYFAYARDLGAAMADSAVENTHTVPCGGCGAEVRFEGVVTAKTCPFCDTPLSAPKAAQRRFRPSAVAPFLISEREARAALARWLKGRWFAPGDLAGAARAGRPLYGVYLPFWTFDADTRSDYVGQRGDVHQVMRWVMVTQNGARRRVRKPVSEIRWRPARGRVRRHFDDVLVLASKSLPDRLSRGLSGGAFDLDGLVPFAPDYLAGFGAEAYRVDLQEGYSAAQAIMAQAIRRDVRFDIGGDRQRIRRIDTTHDDVTFKHVLLPIWIAAYRYRGRVYRYVVNGRTGRVLGERPWSPIKVAVSAAFALAALIALIWIGMLFSSF